MLLKFHETELRLLELFSSSQYFGNMRDKWEEMILHAESCLDAYVSRLPSNYRSRPFPEQPDISWGHRVLPNFRYTLDQLNQAFILLSHGNFDALGYSDNVRSDFKGQLDYEPDWMSEKDQNIYHENINRAMTMAHNISITEHAWWKRVETLSHIEEFTKFPEFSVRRTYRVNKSIYVRSGDKNQITGIYVPDIENCCPQFLSNHHKKTPLTSVLVGTEDLLHPRTGEKYDEQNIYKEVECTWYLIERCEDSEAADMGSALTNHLLKVAAGRTCPQSGFYFTPALPGSRKRFTEGEIMPSLDSTYGQTIWQWDEIQ